MLRILRQPPRADGEEDRGVINGEESDSPSARGGWGLGAVLDTAELAFHLSLHRHKVDGGDPPQTLRVSRELFVFFSLQGRNTCHHGRETLACRESSLPGGEFRVVFPGPLPALGWAGGCDELSVLLGAAGVGRLRSKVVGLALVPPLLPCGLFCWFCSGERWPLLSGTGELGLGLELARI